MNKDITLPNYLFINTIDEEKLIVRTKSYIDSELEALIENGYSDATKQVIQEQIYFIITNQSSKLNHIGKILNKELVAIEA